jgi:hypothetical protein
VTQQTLAVRLHLVGVVALVQLLAAPLALDRVSEAHAECSNASIAWCNCSGLVSPYCDCQYSACESVRSRLVAALKHHLGLRTYAGVSNAYRVSSGWCSIDAMLDSPESVKLYAHTGDSVATNPTETLGVKVEGFAGVSSTECVRAAIRALAHV